MGDYEAIDLSQCVNIGPGLPGTDGTILAGAHALRGLPFQFGSGDAAKAALGFGKGLCEKPVTIAVGAPAKYLIFAHRQIDSRGGNNGHIGDDVARYVVRLTDGSTEGLLIRDRLEIGIIGCEWGTLPILAMSDRHDYHMHRHEGKWHEAGFRQQEALQGFAIHYHLWEWKNPKPGVAVESVTIEPLGPRFYLGAITRSLIDEEPFGRAAMRDVKITLNKAEDAKKPFNLEVAVDRGVAGYPYPLPAQTAQEFIDHPLKGFGEVANKASSPAYVEIAANPSATVTVTQDGKAIGSVNWSEVVRKGSQATELLRVEIIDHGRNWVHTTVLDDETGKPVSCRIHFRSVHGVPYQPHGYHNHVLSDQWNWHVDVGGDLRLGQANYAYISGKCQGWLPRGKLIVDIARGFEYEPIRQMIELKPGQRELTFRLKRFRDMNKERYFSGDTHVHFLSAQGSLTEAAGEDLNVVNLLPSQWGHLFTDTQEFTGRPQSSADGKHVVHVGSENRQHILGHLILLGLKEPVMPWCTDGPHESEMGTNLETTVSRWADACHAQGGTVVIPHFPAPNCEPATLITTGRADAVEVVARFSKTTEEYYRYLNCGYKIPLSGGTDKMDSTVAVGLCRVYVHIPEDEEFSHENWCRHLRNGNSFISSGPLMSMTVEGKPIGSTISMPGNGGTVEVEAAAEGVLPFNALELVVNGAVVARTEDDKGTRSLRLKEKIKIDKHSWIAARCTGKLIYNDSWGREMMGHTSPIYFAVGGDWWMFDPEIARYLLSLMHGGLEYVRKRGRQWDEGSVTHHHSNPDHLKFLEEPFQQAIQAMHKRMHDLGLPH